MNHSDDDDVEIKIDPKSDVKGEPPRLNRDGKVRAPHPELGAAHPSNVSLPPDDEWDGEADIIFIGLMSYGVQQHEAFNWWTRNILIAMNHDLPKIKKPLSRRDLRDWKKHGIQILRPNGMYTYNLLCYLKYETTHPMSIILVGAEANRFYSAIKDRPNTLVMRLNMPTVHNKGSHERFYGSGVFTKAAEFVGKPLTIWRV